jgi:hypothetical protein
MLRTLNNVVRTLLIHVVMPPSYWVEALSTDVFLLNRRPSSSIHDGIPYHLLFLKMPDYSLLRVFGCMCYPNLSATTPHKLSPRSAACVFLGYPPSQKGYWCLDLSTRKIIISRHVVFDETHFPFAASKPRPDSFDFLLQDILPAPALPCPPDSRRSRAANDAGDPVGLDPAILWHGVPTAYLRHPVRLRLLPLLLLLQPSDSGTTSTTPDDRPRHQLRSRDSGTTSTTPDDRPRHQLRSRSWRYLQLPRPCHRQHQHPRKRLQRCL